MPSAIASLYTVKRAAADVFCILQCPRSLPTVPGFSFVPSPRHVRKFLTGSSSGITTTVRRVRIPWSGARVLEFYLAKSLAIVGLDSFDSTKVYLFLGTSTSAKFQNVDNVPFRRQLDTFSSNLGHHDFEYSVSVSANRHGHWSSL